MLNVKLSCVSLSIPDGDSTGLNQEDLAASIATLESLTQTCGVEMLLLREKTTTTGKIVEYLLRKEVEDEDFIEVR
jgi:GTPase